MSFNSCEICSKQCKIPFHYCYNCNVKRKKNGNVCMRCEIIQCGTYKYCFSCKTQMNENMGICIDLGNQNKCQTCNKECGDYKLCYSCKFRNAKDKNI